MKIVIDIPEDDYYAIRNGESLYAIGHDYYDKVVTNAFKLAVVLPEDHGDLIDRDKLRNVCANNQVDITNDGNKNTLIIVDTEDKAWHDLLSEKYAPTVIPADKSEVT